MATWPNEAMAFVRAGIFLVTSLVVAGITLRMLGGVGASTAVAIAVVGAAAVLLVGARRHRLSIGSDGVAIAGGGRPFVSFADIERVERDDSFYGRTHHLAYLVLRGGQRVRVGGRLGLVGHDALSAVDDAYEDLERSLAAYRKRTGVEHASALVRGARSGTDWIRELRARTEAAGFRDGTLAREDLVAVVEDPTADPTARAGAAYALRAAGLNERERTRMRVAGAATAAPKVRVALEAAADEQADDERVVKAVSRVEARRDA